MAWEMDFLHMLQGIHNPILDKVNIFLSDIGEMALVWIILALVFLLFRSTRDWGKACAIAIILTYIIVNLCMKNAFHRLRPFMVDTTVNMISRVPKDWSFPSGHTAHSFCATAAIWSYNKKAGTGALILACLIAFSRMYLFCHYPTDILGGIITGIICGIAAVRILKFIQSRRKSGSANSSEV